jgi:hypothetical protein
MVESSGVSSPAGRRTPIDAGTVMVLVAAIALIAYGAFFVWRNFNGFIELGLTPQHVGGTPDEIRAFSPHLYNYISHLQIAVAGFIIALGVAVMSLAWNGMRHHARWAALTVLTVVIVAVLITLPLHYVYGLATMGHLGPLYVDVVLLVVGSLLSLRASGQGARAPL